MSTVQDHYPERLRAALLLRAPRVFAAAWAAIAPWLDAATAAKVSFVPPADADAERQALLDAGVPAASLPKRYGGAIDDDAIPVPNFHGEPNVGDAPPAAAPADA